MAVPAGPNKEKSYHSRIVPNDEPAMIRNEVNLFIRISILNSYLQEGNVSYFASFSKNKNGFNNGYSKKYTVCQ